MAWKVELSAQVDRELGKLNPQQSKRILKFLHDRRQPAPHSGSSRRTSQRNLPLTRPGVTAFGLEIADFDFSPPFRPRLTRDFSSFLLTTLTKQTAFCTILEPATSLDATLT